MQQFSLSARWICSVVIAGIMLFSGHILPAQERPAYAIFSAEGKPVSYRKMIKKLREADVVFFGELHNNSMGHWLELQVLRDLYDFNPNLALGMEMFEADDQVILDEYLQGFIDEKNFLKETKIWDNYNTDYKPLIEFARQKKLKVVATNVPRRYANLVYRKGVSALDSLSQQIQAWMTPLPLEVDYDLSGYKAMMEGMGQHGSGTARNLVAAQALKDATMAHFIAAHCAGTLFYHINGAYHTQNQEGIITYLKKIAPDLRTLTIHTTEQASLGELDPAEKNKGDFIICIPDDMTRTY